MPRVYERKAAKDYPRFGITKGQTYFDWTMKTGPRSSLNRKSLTRPRQSQLTMSAFLSGYYGIMESVEDATTLEDLGSIAEDLRNLGEEEASKRENMPESLQDSPTGEILNARAESCSTVADEIDGLIENYEPPDEDDADEEVGEDEEQDDGDSFSDLKEEILEALGNVDCG